MKTGEELEKVLDILSHIYAYTTMNTGRDMGTTGEEDYSIKSSGSVQDFNPDILAEILSSDEDSSILNGLINIGSPEFVFEKIISELSTFFYNRYGLDVNALTKEVPSLLAAMGPVIKERFLSALGRDEEERRKNFNMLVKRAIKRAVEILRSRGKDANSIVTLLSFDGYAINSPRLVNFVKTEFVAMYFLLLIVSKKVNKSVSEIAEEIIRYYKRKIGL